MDKQSCSHTIPSAFVPLNYLNDPETEDIIFGDQLESGMVILAEGQLLRANPDDYQIASVHEQARIQQTARWCRLVDIRQHGDVQTLICEYADGSKCSRRYNITHNWFVKKASMPG